MLQAKRNPFPLYITSSYLFGHSSEQWSKRNEYKPCFRSPVMDLLKDCEVETDPRLSGWYPDARGTEEAEKLRG